MNTRIIKRAWNTGTSRARIASIGPTGALLAGVLIFGVVAYAGATATRLRQFQPRSTFSLRASPPRRTITVGSTARYRLRIRRVRFSGVVALRVAGGLPRGTLVRLSPRRARRSQSILIVRTSAETPPGTYVLRVRAARGRVRRTASVTLTVRRASPGGGVASVTSPPFTISGDVEEPLTPGFPRPVDLSIVNPNSLPLTLSEVTVTITTLTAPKATDALPCTLADFAVQQYSGPYPLVIPPSSGSTLQALGIPASEWPQVALIDLPHDQDGCQGASLMLLYTAAATLG